jgi:uncharacterized Zn finger protein
VNFLGKLFGRGAAKDEDIGGDVKASANAPNCSHEWTRTVDQEGTSLRVYTKCSKCGEVMKPSKTVHHDMR